MFVIVQRSQREHLVVEHQTKGSATESAPYPQAQHLLDKLGLWYPKEYASVRGNSTCLDQP